MTIKKRFGLKIKAGMIVAAVNPENGEANEYMEVRQPKHQAEGQKRAAGGKNKDSDLNGQEVVAKKKATATTKNKSKAKLDKKSTAGYDNDYLKKLRATQGVGESRGKTNKKPQDGQNKGGSTTKDGQVEPKKGTVTQNGQVGEGSKVVSAMSNSERAKKQSERMTRAKARLKSAQAKVKTAKTDKQKEAAKGALDRAKAYFNKVAHTYRQPNKLTKKRTAAASVIDLDGTVVATMAKRKLKSNGDTRRIKKRTAAEKQAAARENRKRRAITKRKNKVYTSKNRNEIKRRAELRAKRRDRGDTRTTRMKMKTQQEMKAAAK